MVSKVLVDGPDIIQCTTSTIVVTLPGMAELHFLTMICVLNALLLQLRSCVWYLLMADMYLYSQIVLHTKSTLLLCKFVLKENFLLCVNRLQKQAIKITVHIVSPFRGKLNKMR